MLLDIKLKQFFFSLARILTNFKRCHLQTKNLKKLIFVNKNWPNDPIIGCKFHLTYWNSLKGMKLLKCKTSINKI